MAARPLRRSPRRSCSACCESRFRAPMPARCFWPACFSSSAFRSCPRSPCRPCRRRMAASCSASCRSPPASFAALIGGERPSILFWICGVAGAALVVLFAMRDGGMQLSPGDIWLFLAGLVGQPRLCRLGQAGAEDAGLGSDLLGADRDRAGLGRRRCHDLRRRLRARKPRPDRGFPLSRLRLDVPRLLRLECRPGDGRHRARQPGPAAAGNS